MARFEVETDLIIHAKIKVMVDADNAAAAIDAAAGLHPTNHDLARAKAWKAEITLKPPRGVTLAGTPRAIHFEQASGADKARKVAP